MSLFYSHIMIPTEADRSPSVSRILDLLAGGPPWVDLLEYRLVNHDEPRVAEIARNASTGEMVSVRTPPHSVFGNLEAVRREAEPLVNLDLSAHGRCAARKSPLIAMGGYAAGKWCFVTEDFDVEIRCAWRSSKASMSDLHQKCRIEFERAPFGEPASHSDPDAYFTHPETLDVLAVEGAASSRFWIELRFGNWMVPRVDDGIKVKKQVRRGGAPVSLCDIQLVTDPFADRVREALDLDCVEGFHWG